MIPKFRGLRGYLLYLYAMRNVFPILLLMLLVACSKEEENHAPLPVPEPELQSEPVTDNSGAEPDTLVNVLLTDTLWNNLSICSHPWVNIADYDHARSKWIIHEEDPLQAEFSCAFYSRNSGTMITGKDNKDSWFCFPKYSTFGICSGHESFAISVIGKDYFVLCNSHLSMLFSFNEPVDTSRITVLDTTDQMEDPAFLWPFDEEGTVNKEDEDGDEEE